MYYSEKVEEHLPKLEETMNKITKTNSDFNMNNAKKNIFSRLVIKIDS